MAMQDRFLIKDPVHGSIELHGKYLVSIINSKEFQRLRKIKQLGGACYVYPGATHTRFEHSIGVCYIASELIEHLKKNYDLRQDENSQIFKKWSPDREANPPDRDGKRRPDIIKCVKTAALCHDLGHGPFSHLYDFAIEKVDQPNKTEEKHLMHHEYRSVEIFKRIRNNRDNKIYECFSNEEVELVGKLITFSKDYEKPDEYKKPNREVKKILDAWLDSAKELDKTYNYKEVVFVFEIVANGITGVDVDKMDYFLRDGHFTGLTGIFDWRRYIQTSEIREKDGFRRLCSRDKEALEIYQLFHIRNQLFHQAYRHKTTIAVEYMLKQTLIKANGSLVIKIGDVSKPILSAWDDMEYFLHLTDSIEDIIMLDLNNEPAEKVVSNKTLSPFYLKVEDRESIQEARCIIRSIRERKLIKFIGEINGIIKESASSDDVKQLAEDVKEKFKKKICQKFTKKDKDGKADVIAVYGTQVTVIQGVAADGVSIIQGVTNEVSVKGEFIVESTKFNYGMQDKDPIEANYLFTQKGLANNSPNPLRREEVSTMLPQKFMERKLMCYVYQKEQKLTDEHMCILRQFLQKIKREL